MAVYNAKKIEEKLTNKGLPGLFDTGSIGEGHHAWIQKLFTEAGVKNLESVVLNNETIKVLYSEFSTFFTNPTPEKAVEIEKKLEKMPKVKIVKESKKESCEDPEVLVLEPGVCEHCGRGGSIYDTASKLINLIIKEAIAQSRGVIRPAKKK